MPCLTTRLRSWAPGTGWCWRRCTYHGTGLMCLERRIFLSPLERMSIDDETLHESVYDDYQ